VTLDMEYHIYSALGLSWAVGVCCHRNIQSHTEHLENKC
jgi:hypothetical protein